MCRIVHEILSHGAIYRHSIPYRGTGSSDESDSIEQIGGLEPQTALNASLHPTKRPAQAYDNEQVEAALELLGVNSLSDLSRQNFSAFGKKQSWIQLANGCITRLAADMLSLDSIGETAERCMLLHDRLQTRKAERIRTPNEAQSAIQNLYIASVSIRDMWRLSEGKRVGDVEMVVGRAQSLMSTWRVVQSLVPATKANTERLISIVRKALSNVIKNTELRQMTREMARKGLVQWHGAPPSQVPGGTKVEFDSDDDE